MASAPAATERLLLREMIDADAPAILDLFADDYARAFYPDMIDIDAARAWIGRNQERYKRDGFGLWALIERQSGTLVGDCGLTWQVVEHRDRLEVGYHIAAAWRGRGLALEAARAALAHGFAVDSTDEIGSIVAPDNKSSASVAKRLHRHVRIYRNARGLDRYFFFTGRAEHEAATG